MFRSRSKFDNETPMSRRGMRVGLVVTVALAMVAVLATTVGVLSSQSTTPSLTVGNAAHIGFEGDAITVVLTPTASTDYTLTLAITPAGGFDFAQDIAALELSLDGGSTTPIETFPHSVVIASSVSMITLEFTVANDLLTESNESFTLSATPSGGTAVTTVISLNDPPVVEATFSVSSPITEGGSAEIGITLSEPLTLFHLFNRRTGQSGYTREEFTGSNFEDISSMAGAAFPVDDNNERYGRSLGFDFWFYGTQHSDIAVHTNGFVGFTDDPQADVEEFANPTMGAFMGDATPGTNLPIVAPLLSPIGYINQTGAAFYGARLGAGTAEDRYIVQYTNAATLINEGAGTRAASTFQVALYASGTIEFRYQNIPTTVQNVSKIGISNGTGTGMFDEFSYRATNLGATSNVRLVYTPKDSVINAVIKNSAGDTVETVDLLENVAVGAQRGSFMVSYPENTDWDGNQVYTVELESAMPLLVAAPSPAPAAVMYTVNDNDDPMVTLQRVSGSGPIAEGTSVELRALLTNPPSGGAPENLVVNLVADPASTVDSGDHDLPASVTIDQGETEKKFEVTATDDMLAEFNEMLTIKVNTLGYGGNTPTPATQAEINVEITSDDTIAVTGITASDTNEGDDVTVMVTLNRALPAGTADDAVKLVLDGTDRINDITDSSWNIASDLRSSTSVELMLTLTEDMLLEGTEQVTLNLVVDSALDDILPAGDRMSGVSFNILDDEDGDVSITLPGGKADYGENESVVLRVGLASGVTTVSAIMVNYEIDLISADAGDIVNGANLMRSAIIPADQSGVAVTIALTDDSVAEKRELFDVFLTGVSSSDAMVNSRVAITATSPSVAISILDNEPLAYSFEGSGTVSEDNPAYKVKLTRLGMLPGSGGGAMVAYTVAGSGSRAASAADFAGSSFPAGGDFVFTGYAAESAEITLTVADDAVIEGDEAFRIALTSRPETHDVTLVDNDQPQVVVERVSGSTPVAEGDPVRLVARLTNGVPSGATEDITVNLALRAGRTGSASDVSFPASVVIARGSLTETFTVDVKSDGLAEFNEVVNIYVEGVNTVTLGPSTSADTGYDLEITSADMITAEIEVSDTTEGGMARVQITLDRLLPDRTPANVLSLVLLSGYATEADVRIVSKDITTELESSLTTDVMIELIDDKLLEGNETVRVMLRIEPGMSPDLATLLPDLPSASFEIIDDESGMVSLVSPSATEYYESVGGNSNNGVGNSIAQTVNFEVKLPDGVVAAIPVRVYYSMSVAGGPTAFGPVLAPGFAKGLALPVRGFAQVPSPTFVTIPVGESRATLPIMLPNDEKAEVTEQLTVRLDRAEATGVPGVDVDPDNKEEVIMVLDDENPTYEIIGSGEVDEDDGTYPVRLRRLGRLTHNGMAVKEIQFEIVGDGADEGDFAGPLIRKFTFSSPGNALSELISLPLEDDNSEESQKTFQIRVYAPGQMPGQVTPQAAPIVDSSGARFASVILLDFDVADFLGDLPATGGPVLPVWLLLALALTGVVLLGLALYKVTERSRSVRTAASPRS